MVCTLIKSPTSSYLTTQSAILSTLEVEDHKTAYVKGGLFTKNGIELPPPGAEVFWNRREKWEKPTEGIEPQ
jgi:hypothetical protein